MTGAVFGAVSNKFPLRSIDFERSSNQYLSKSSANFGSFSGTAFSFSCWANQESTGITQRICAKGSAFFIGFNSSDQVTFSISSGGVTYSRTTSLSFGAGYRQIGFVYDANNATAAQRLRIYVNGSEGAYTGSTSSPSLGASIDTNSNDVIVGAGAGGASAFDGLIWQPAFYSGTIPSMSGIYTTKNAIQSGLFSMLYVPNDVVTTDYVQSTAWTNNNGAVSSTSIP